MNQGFDGKPAVTHTIVTCPVSLVTNWESELKKKWIGEERLQRKGIDVIAVSEATKTEVKGMIRRFTFGRAAILIISYETFRIHEVCPPPYGSLAYAIGHSQLFDARCDARRAPSLLYALAEAFQQGKSVRTAHLR